MESGFINEENYIEENENQKLEIKRLLIYLTLAFGLSWALFLAYSLTGHKWDGTNPYLEQLVGLGMLVPFIAHILTRMITKEGFALTGKDSLMLGISFKDKKWKYYLFALFMPWIYTEISNLLTLAIVPEAFDTSLLKEAGLSNGFAFSFPFVVMVSTSIISFAALGEEGGWRGYMMPKLIKLIGMPKAILLGGIIWGIWHAPLTVIGHNFGTDYTGFPYVGIIIMCILCTLIGIMLTFITIKTGSIWPAAIMHAVNNGGPCISKFYINSDIFTEKCGSSLMYWLFILLPMAVIDGIIIVYEVKRSKE